MLLEYTKASHVPMLLLSAHLNSKSTIKLAEFTKFCKKYLKTDRQTNSSIIANPSTHAQKNLTIDIVKR